MSPALAGLEVIALGPFIPGIEEDHGLGRTSLIAFPQHTCKPTRVALWRAAMHDYALRPSPRGVVPRWCDAAKIGVRWHRFGAHALDHVVVSEDVMAALPCLLQLWRQLLRVQIMEGVKIRLELDHRIKPALARIAALLHTLRLDFRQEQFSDSEELRLLTPHVHHVAQVMDRLSAKDQEQRLAVDTDVTLVEENLAQPANVVEVIGHRIALFDEERLGAVVPISRPVMVGPAQAEGKVGAARAQDLVDGQFEESFTVQPVMVVAKAVDAVTSCEARLLLADLGDTQVIEAHVRRQVWLPVAGKLRNRARDVRPFREALAPPQVVFRNGMELWQMKGNGLACRCRLNEVDRHPWPSCGAADVSYLSVARCRG